MFVFNSRRPIEWRLEGRIRIKRSKIPIHETRKEELEKKVGVVRI